MRNPPRLFAASVSLLLLLLSAPAARAQGEIRVAAWNVQGVRFVGSGARPRRRGSKRTAGATLWPPA